MVRKPRRSGSLRKAIGGRTPEMHGGKRNRVRKSARRFQKRTGANPEKKRSIHSMKKGVSDPSN